jgi:outer membrane protein assembly factor BamB
LRWSETNNVKWKTEIPYKGWATPVIMGGQVWLANATEDGHDFFAICADEKTGKILFNEKLFHSDNPEPLGNGASMNCYATPSPVIEPGRVYVHLGVLGRPALIRKRERRFGSAMICGAGIIAAHLRRRFSLKI